jgi:hypothetical protein
LQITFPPAPAGAKGVIFLGPPEAPGVIPLPAEVKDSGKALKNGTPFLPMVPIIRLPFLMPA